MPQLLIKPSDVFSRLRAGETATDIFIGEGGAPKAKLVGPLATTSASADVERGIDFDITTQAVDRYMDTISLGGWRTKNYEANPVVLWAHDDSIPAIARGVNLRLTGRAMRSTAVFAEREIHPLADTIYQLVLRKFINAASVGLIPIAAKVSNSKDRPQGLDITEQELLEWSVCNIPANPECLVQARSVGIDTAPLIGWAERVLDNGNMLMIPKAELEELRKAAGAPTVYAAAIVDDPGDATKRRTALLVKRVLGRKTKGLYDLGFFASLMAEFGMLASWAEWEAEMEGDGSNVPAMLVSILFDMADAFMAMSQEEVAEFLADFNAEPDTAGLDDTDVAYIGAGVSVPARCFRAGRVKARLLTEGRIEKAGRVLSAENQKKLRDAHTQMSAACDIVKGVADSADVPEPDAEGGNIVVIDDQKAARDRRERIARARKAQAGAL